MQKQSLKPGPEFHKATQTTLFPAHLLELVMMTFAAYVIKIGAGDDVLIVISHRKFNGLASGSKFIEYK